MKFYLVMKCGILVTEPRFLTQDLAAAWGQAREMIIAERDDYHSYKIAEMPLAAAVDEPRVIIEFKRFDVAEMRMVGDGSMRATGRSITARIEEREVK